MTSRYRPPRGALLSSLVSPLTITRDTDTHCISTHTASLSEGQRTLDWWPGLHTRLHDPYARARARLHSAHAHGLRGVRPNPTSIVHRTTTSPRREATHHPAFAPLTPSHVSSQHRCPGRNTPLWEVTSLIGHAAVLSARARPHIALRTARASRRSRSTRGAGPVAPLAPQKKRDGRAGRRWKSKRSEKGRRTIGRRTPAAVHGGTSGGLAPPSFHISRGLPRALRARAPLSPRARRARRASIRSPRSRPHAPRSAARARTHCTQLNCTVPHSTDRDTPHACVSW